MRFLLVILLVLSPVVLANECRGNWSIAAQGYKVDVVEDTIRLPLVITIDEELLNCGASSIFLRSDSRGNILLRSQGNVLSGKLVSNSGATIGTSVANGVLIPVDFRSQKTIWLEFASAKHANPGVYRSVIRADLNLAENRKRKQQQESVELRILPYVDIEIAGSASGNKTLDLGVLRSGKEGSLAVNMISNTSFNMVFQSKNGGLLLKGSQNDRIDYSIYLSGRKISFEDPITLARTPRTGVVRPLLIRVGNTNGALAGQYSDTVTITATARP